MPHAHAPIVPPAPALPLNSDRSSGAPVHCGPELGRTGPCPAYAAIHDPRRKGVRVSLLTLGVMARSRKEHERRLAILPHHTVPIPDDPGKGIYLERGYGEQS